MDTILKGVPLKYTSSPILLHLNQWLMRTRLQFDFFCIKIRSYFRNREKWLKKTTDCRESTALI